MMAKNKKTEETFAIKIFVKEKIENNPKDCKNLKNEIDILRKLDHELCNKFYEVHESADYVYLVLEHLKGGPLFDVENVVKYGLTATTHVIKQIL